MIFPFQFDTMPELERLRPVADIIAQYSGWPELYDEWQLARNEVPLYAATYVDDMYVCKYPPILRKIPLSLRRGSCCESGLLQFEIISFCTKFH